MGSLKFTDEVSEVAQKQKVTVHVTEVICGGVVYPVDVMFYPTSDGVSSTYTEGDISVRFYTTYPRIPITAEFHVLLKYKDMPVDSATYTVTVSTKKE